MTTSTSAPPTEAWAERTLGDLRLGDRFKLGPIDGYVATITLAPQRSTVTFRPYWSARRMVRPIPPPRDSSGARANPDELLRRYAERWIRHMVKADESKAPYALELPTVTPVHVYVGGPEAEQADDRIALRLWLIAEETAAHFRRSDLMRDGLPADDAWVVRETRTMEQLAAACDELTRLIGDGEETDA